jgi:hypothetical protein
MSIYYKAIFREKASALPLSYAREIAVVLVRQFRPEMLLFSPASRGYPYMMLLYHYLMGTQVKMVVRVRLELIYYCTFCLIRALSRHIYHPLSLRYYFIF